MKYKILFGLIFVIFVFSFVDAVELTDAQTSQCDACFYGEQYGICRTVRLTQEEVRKLWDSYHFRGFRGSSLYTGEVLKQTQQQNKTAESASSKSDVPTEINLVTPDKSGAIAVGLPSESKSADSRDFTMNQSCKGDYAYGLILSDTLRVARCPNGDDLNNCAINRTGLQYRNSESYIELLKKSALEAITGKESATKQFVDELQPTQDVPAKNSDDGVVIPVSDLSLVDEAKALQYITPTRKSSERITNHIQTELYAGAFQNACSGEDASDRCKVVLVSYFDRYYNAYYSGTAVASFLGPVMIGLSQKTFSKFGELKPFAKSTRESTKLMNEFNDFWNKAWNTSLGKDLENVAVNSKAEIARLDEQGFLKFRKANLGNLADSDTIKAMGDFQKDGIPALMKSSYDDIKTAREGLEAITKNSAVASQTIDAIDDKVAKSKAIFTYFDKSGSDAAGLDGPKAFLDNPAFSKYKGQFVLDDKRYYPPSHPAVKSKFFSGEVTETYMFKPSNPTLYDIPKAASSFDEAFVSGFAASENASVLLPAGYYIPLNKEALAIIGTLPPATKLQVYTASSATFVPSIDFKYDELMSDWSKWGKKQIDNITKNSKAMHNMMVAQGVIDQRYANLLNYFLYNNKTTFYNKTIWRKMATGIVAPLAYWKLKTSDSLTIWQAYNFSKGEYSNVQFSLGQETVYSDAYMDVFVNESINNGDFFENIFKSATSILGERFGEPTVNTLIGLITRDDVKDIILYTSTQNNCPDCASTFNTKDGKAVVTTRALQDTTNYALEFPDGETYTEYGLSLATFLHHTNLDFKTPALEQTINIQKGITGQNTCVDKAKAMALFGSFDFMTDTPTRVGLAVGIADNFYSGKLPGLLLLPAGPMSLVVGAVISYALSDWMSDTFKDCIDSEDGYYVQYIYQPPEEKKTGVTDTLKNLVTVGNEAVKENSAGNKFDDIMSGVKKNIEGVITSAKKEFLQLYYTTNGKSTTHLESNSIFLIWINGGSMCTQTKLNKDAVVKICDEKGENCMEINNKDETLKDSEGNVIIQSPVIPYAGVNLRTGAFEIPQTVSFIPAYGNQDFFEFTQLGDVLVKNSDTMNCIRNGIREQTGKELNDVSLVSVMGLVDEINLVDGTNIKPLQTHFAILGGVLARENVVNQSLIVNSGVHLTGNIEGVQTDLGEFASVIMQKGVIMYDAEHREFGMWVRILAEMLGSEVKGMKADITDVKNPLNGCDEHAVNLSVVPNELDYDAVKDGQEFNQALERAGPFQYFETKDKAFMIYSKLVDGQCKNFLKVIDKTTGETLVDQEISSIEETADGFNVKTADGKTHTFEFGSENGAPVLTYNGVKDKLLMAQGRNGSFYFDPKTNKWNVGNSQMLPLDDSYRENGLLNVGGAITASKNPLYQSTSKNTTEGGWDIPLIPEDKRILFVFASLGIALCVLYFSQNKNFQD